MLWEQTAEHSYVVAVTRENFGEAEKNGGFMSL